MQLSGRIIHEFCLRSCPEPMSQTKDLSCLLCGTKCPSRSSLTCHIYKHLSYRKYECCSCGGLFYTEEERETHCLSEGHFHGFGTKVSPYSEVYADQLLKDAEYAQILGVDVVVKQRFQANMTCHSAMINLSKNEYGDMSMSSGSSGNPEAPSTSKLQKSINESPSHASGNPGGTHQSGAGDTLHAPLIGSADKHAEHSSHIRVLPGSQLRQGRCKASRANRSSNRVSSGNRRHIENKCSEATEMASETLRSNAFVAQCMICKTLTPSEYVLRKLHVSSTHLNKGHTHSDCVEILSDLMKKAYPTLPYNDFQCQIGGCRKEYKSQSARRSHVLRVHFRHELCCPLKCSYRSNDFANVNTHLKEDHHLANGYLSIESQQVRSQFSKERAKHNRLLNNLVLVAFPCPVADSGPIHTQAPPNSLRSHIAKPFSDRDSQVMVCSSLSSTDFSDESDVESNDVSAKLDKMKNTNDEDEDDKHGGVIVLD